MGGVTCRLSKLKLHRLYLLIGRGSWWSRGEREGAAKAVVQRTFGEPDGSRLRGWDGGCFCPRWEDGKHADPAASERGLAREDW